METFNFKFVATTGETYEFSVKAVSTVAAIIKMTRDRKAKYGNDKIWQAVR